MSAFLEETVLSVHHWTDRLFSFTTTRDQALRFSNGHFTMIGLKVNGKPLLRAYSIASANYEEHLEFLSIKVQDGPPHLTAATHPGGRQNHRGQKTHWHAAD
jgi:ferredoxin--NADP+ reductase